jgi:hypothetical protein
MRIGLIAALGHSEDGHLRAMLPIAGRSVLAWQAGLLQSLGIERVLCLTEAAGIEVITLQQALEAQGVQFHALKGIAAIPALVRAEDDLVILADGLMPDPAAVRNLIDGKKALRRAVVTIPADHPLATAHPHVFERIDAARHWAGLLVMRGAPAQQLAAFPPDAHAISLLMRLALQAGTPSRELDAGAMGPESWLFADSVVVTGRLELVLIARAAPPADWGAPGNALALALVRALMPRGLAEGPLVAGGAALVLMLLGVMATAFGFAAIGLVLAGLGAFAEQVAHSFAALAASLRGQTRATGGALSAACDLLAGLTAWLALAPIPDWQPLAVVGPVVIGLTRIAARQPVPVIGTAAGDRAGILLFLAIGAGFGLLAEVLACLALGLVAALMLRRDGE